MICEEFGMIKARDKPTRRSGMFCTGCRILFQHFQTHGETKSVSENKPYGVQNLNQ